MSASVLASAKQVLHKVGLSETGEKLSTLHVRRSDAVKRASCPTDVDAVATKVECSLPPDFKGTMLLFTDEPARARVRMCGVVWSWRGRCACRACYPIPIACSSAAARGT